MFATVCDISAEASRDILDARMTTAGMATARVTTTRRDMQPVMSGTLHHDAAYTSAPWLREDSLGEAFMLLGVILTVVGMSRYFDAVQRKRDRLERWQREHALWQAIRQAAAVDAAERERQRLEQWEREQVGSAAAREAASREMRQRPRPVPPLSTWN